MNNIFSILNGYNNILKISRIEYNMKPKYIYEFESKLQQYRHALQQLDALEESMIEKNDWKRGQYIREPWTQEDYDQLLRDRENLKSDEFMADWSGYDYIPRIFWKNKKICEYLDVIPFTPSIMINISPDWDDTRIDRISIPRKIKFLQNIIEMYMAECERYDKYSYVIENGESGNNIHAHIVAHINPRLSKSVETHINKNKHVYQIKKYGSRIKLRGSEFLIKNNSVQRSYIRTEEILKDKLDYLTEDLKPEGHKNHSVIGDGRVDRVLFTVK